MYLIQSEPNMGVCRRFKDKATYSHYSTTGHWTEELGGEIATFTGFVIRVLSMCEFTKAALHPDRTKASWVGQE